MAIACQKLADLRVGSPESAHGLEQMRKFKYTPTGWLCRKIVYYLLMISCIASRFARIAAVVSIVLLAAGNAWAIDKCGSGKRYTCVVDGDTIWFEGTKIRVLGYDTPEPMTNICGGNYERQLAARATARFMDLLNTHGFRIVSTGETDRYGRLLARIMVNGENVGNILIREGLARRYPNGREFWCE